MSHVRIERRMFSLSEKAFILKKTNGKCAHCGKSLTSETTTVDHVFPIDRGGIHDEYNLLPLCELCNADKSNYVYYPRDYYKYILPEFEDRYTEYFNYVSFDYSHWSIMGVDEKMFYFLSDKSKEMLNQMYKRHTKKDRLDDMYKRLQIPIHLRRAYPANAKAIYEMMQTMSKMEGFDLNFDIYPDELSVLSAIEHGEVYILEKSGKINGVFMYEDVSKLLKKYDYNQLECVVTATGLRIKYMMTCALIDYFAYPVFSDVMEYLDNTQIANGWLPIYFNILDKMYREQEACIKLPYELHKVQGFIEFASSKHLYERDMENLRDIFESHGYMDASDDDIKQFSEYYIKYKYQTQIKKDEDAKRFFKRYSRLKTFFKPENYEFYDVGLVIKE